MKKVLLVLLFWALTFQVHCLAQEHQFSRVNHVEMRGGFVKNMSFIDSIGFIEITPPNQYVPTHTIVIYNSRREVQHRIVGFITYQKDSFTKWVLLEGGLSFTLNLESRVATLELDKAHDSHYFLDPEN